MMIGEVLKSWRQKRDLGVREAGRLIGVSHGTISRIERGEQIDAGTLLKLMAWLFNGEVVTGPAQRRTGR